MVTMSTPLAMSWLAWVCRSPWKVISGMPIRPANAPQSDETLLGLSGLPSSWGEQQGVVWQPSLP